MDLHSDWAKGAQNIIENLSETEASHLCISKNKAAFSVFLYCQHLLDTLFLQDGSEEETNLTEFERSLKFKLSENPAFAVITTRLKTDPSVTKFWLRLHRVDIEALTRLSRMSLEDSTSLSPKQLLYKWCASSVKNIYVPKETDLNWFKLNVKRVLQDIPAFQILLQRITERDNADMVGKSEASTAVKPGEDVPAPLRIAIDPSQYAENG
ncbi:MAG: hypothetical protein SGARI_002115, partial [Bacillariaceae sp.]